ncbi:hypothetical protein PInf_013662 [Phytophthora infestans]|nr:hypothetical protein PInf_013662 [Phytophthora infestans]
MRLAFQSAQAKHTQRNDEQLESAHQRIRHEIYGEMAESELRLENKLQGVMCTNAVETTKRLDTALHRQDEAIEAFGRKCELLGVNVKEMEARLTVLESKLSTDGDNERDGSKQNGVESLKNRQVAEGRLSIPQYGSRDGDSYKWIEGLLRGLVKETITSVRTITHSSVASQKVAALAEEKDQDIRGQPEPSHVRRDVLVQRHHR